MQQQTSASRSGGGRPRICVAEEEGRKESRRESGWMVVLGEEVTEERAARAPDRDKTRHQRRKRV